MTRRDDRFMDAGRIWRRRATEDTKRKIAGWEIRRLEGPVAQFRFASTVSFFVHEGAAELALEGVAPVDLRAGDFLTIEAEALVNWNISEPVRASFLRHDSCDSASNRVPLVRWRND